MQKENGLKVQSWSDILAVVMLATVIISAVVWGLKLESLIQVERERTNNAEREISRLKASIDAGILNVAETRLNAHDRRLERLESQKE